MFIVENETKKIRVINGELHQGSEVVLWSDTTPQSLEIDGDDIGLPGVDILPGSILMTPAKRYVMGESGSFVEVQW